MLYLPDGVDCKASKYQQLVCEPDLNCAPLELWASTRLSVARIQAPCC